ncbi:MAG: glycosyltransferase family 4 protein, partial [Pseudomonadota bacterium]
MTALSILFVTPSLRRSGPSRQMLYLASGMRERGHRVLVRSLSTEGADSIIDHYRAADIDVDELHLPRLFSTGRAIAKIDDVCRQEKIDIIHSHGLRADRVAQRVHCKAIHVATLRNQPYDDYPAKFGRLIGMVMARLHANFIKRADHPVACSHSLAAALKNIRPSIPVITNGVDCDYFFPIIIDDEYEQKVRRRLNINSSHPIIVSIGSLISRKRPDLLLSLYLNSELSKTHTLVFAGSGVLIDELKASAAQSSRVCFLDEIDDVREILNIASVFVSVSKSEGLPNSVMEALAVGVPTILSDIPPHRELHVDQWNAGIVLEKMRPSDLANAVTRIEYVEHRNVCNNARV